MSVYSTLALIAFQTALNARVSANALCAPSHSYPIILVAFVNDFHRLSFHLAISRIAHVISAASSNSGNYTFSGDLLIYLKMQQNLQDSANSYDFSDQNIDAPEDYDQTNF